jgi:hypothetical protein
VPISRRLVIADGNDVAITMFDMSDIDNSNNDAPLQFTVQTQCDLGHWHTDSRTDIPPYGGVIANANRSNGRRSYSSDSNGHGASRNGDMNARA